MREGYTLIFHDVIIIDCCEARKKWLEERYEVKQMAHIENALVKIPHCRLGCLKGEKHG